MILMGEILNILIPLPAHDRCDSIFRAIDMMVMLGNAAKGYLFLLRVRIVYGKSKLATLYVISGALVVIIVRLVGMFLGTTSVSLAFKR